MHDIRNIRLHPEAFETEMTRRRADFDLTTILNLDTRRRDLIQELEQARSQRKKLSEQFGKAKKEGGSGLELTAEISAIKNTIDQSQSSLEDASSQLDRILLELPNILEASVPDGADEEDNRVESVVGDIPKFDFEPKTHDELGLSIRGEIDFGSAAKISGARFVVLRGQLAKLERVMASFMIDLHTSKHGYVEVSPPLLVSADTMAGTGQLPKFAEDLFSTTDGRYLIPTAEVPLTNLVREEIVDASRLPLRMTAHTPCFRREAGSAGRDTKGMLRQHQFNKVELVSVVKPADSQAELLRMRQCAEAVLQMLELPYRVVTLCSGDTGFSAKHTFDIEVWLPGQARYREISSCSNCGDFQARRMKARYRDDEGKVDFLHTLNGSGVAVGRALIAVLENGQQADGSIRLPKVLAEKMGCDVIASN